jgi:hypothetical protein
MLQISLNPLYVMISLDGTNDTERAGNPWANRYPMLIEFDMMPFDTGNPQDGGQAQITRVDIFDSLGTLQESRVLPGDSLKFTKIVQNFWNWNDAYRQPLPAWDGEDARAYGGWTEAFEMTQYIDDLKYDADGDTVPEPAEVRCYFQEGYFYDPRWVEPAWLALTPGATRVVPFNFTVSVTDGTGHKTTERVYYQIEEYTSQVSGNAYYNSTTPWVGVTVDLYVNTFYVTSTISGVGGAYVFPGVSAGNIEVRVEPQLSPDGVQSGSNTGVVPPDAVLNIPCTGI